jgi:hypothetical protein
MRATDQHLEATNEAAKRLESIASVVSRLALCSRGEGRLVFDRLAQTCDDAVYFINEVALVEDDD